MTQGLLNKSAHMSTLKGPVHEAYTPSEKVDLLEILATAFQRNMDHSDPTHIRDVDQRAETLMDTIPRSLPALTNGAEVKSLV
ncbi:hypothetical protein PR048_024969 [Dryococelus australis]|uniref:Uncharacterized protein n=1 Tax=Dryococelus australis TaxID=614101 RepID=A0ABQ9GQ13_9NEOP|nr:hypothetical protein PR048_024969 [Dryococelus australis]